VHAARVVLHGVRPEGGIEQSAEVGLRHGLPHTAGEVPPSAAVVVAAHRQAWKVASLHHDDPRRRILEEQDRVRRVKLGIDLGVDEPELAQLVTQALEATDGEGSRVGVATAMFLALRDEHALRPSAWGTLTDLADRSLTPREQVLQVAPGRSLENWREISHYLSTLSATRRDRLMRGFLLGGFPTLWEPESWEVARKRFGKTLDLFGVET
jgi:hypothetical protein